MATVHEWISSCSCHISLTGSLKVPKLAEPGQTQVWPGSVHYPDFFSPVTAAYWEAELRAFIAMAPYDGARLLPQPALLCGEVVALHGLLLCHHSCWLAFVPLGHACAG